VLSSSSLLLEILTNACALRRWQLGLPAAAVIILFLHTLTDVQRRGGHLRPLVAIGRASLVTGIGAAYAALFGFFIYRIAHGLQMSAPAKLVVLCSASALMLGFVFYLFWQDRSIGDPL